MINPYKIFVGALYEVAILNARSRDGHGLFDVVIWTGLLKSFCSDGAEDPDFRKNAKTSEALSCLEMCAGF